MWKTKQFVFSWDLAPRAVSQWDWWDKSPKCWGLECISITLGLTSRNQSGLEWAELILHGGSVGVGGRGAGGGGSITHTQLNEQHQEQLNVSIRMSEVILHICTLQCRWGTVWLIMRQNVFCRYLAIPLSAILDILRTRELIFHLAENCIVPQGLSNYLSQQGAYL